MVHGCSGGSKARTLNRKFPMVQSLIQSGMSPTGTRVPVARKPVLWIANSQWFKVSYNQGSPPVVSSCCGGKGTRTLHRKFAMVQSLIQSECPQSYSVAMVAKKVVSGCWWLKNPYSESRIRNGSRSHTVRDVP